MNKTHIKKDLYVNSLKAVNQEEQKIKDTEEKGGPVQLWASTGFFDFKFDRKITISKPNTLIHQFNKEIANLEKIAGCLEQNHRWVKTNSGTSAKCSTCNKHLFGHFKHKSDFGEKYEELLDKQKNEIYKEAVPYIKELKNQIPKDILLSEKDFLDLLNGTSELEWPWDILEQILPFFDSLTTISLSCAHGKHKKIEVIQPPTENGGPNHRKVQCKHCKIPLMNVSEDNWQESFLSQLEAGKLIKRSIYRIATIISEIFHHDKIPSPPMMQKFHDFLGLLSLEDKEVVKSLLVNRIHTRLDPLSLNGDRASKLSKGEITKKLEKKNFPEFERRFRALKDKQGILGEKQNRLLLLDCCFREIFPVSLSDKEHIISTLKEEYQKIRDEMSKISKQITTEEKQWFSLS